MRFALPLLALAAALAGGVSAGAAAVARGAGPVATAACAPGSKVPLGSTRRAYAGIVLRPTRAFRAAGQRPFATFDTLNVNGVPTVLGILGKRVDASCRAAWYHVELPQRPNGATGWVRAQDLRVAPVRTRIVVDLSARSVTLLRDGRRILTTRAAVGSRWTPTPLGRYYVNQRLIPQDPSGPYGPGALGISAFSPVLTGWAQGGPIAIHGTNAPWSIGNAVTNGCIRVRNPVLTRLFRSTLAGTPVIIKR